MEILEQMSNIQQPAFNASVWAALCSLKENTPWDPVRKPHRCCNCAKDRDGSSLRFYNPANATTNTQLTLSRAHHGPGPVLCISRRLPQDPYNNPRNWVHDGFHLSKKPSQVTQEVGCKATRVWSQTTPQSWRTAYTTYDNRLQTADGRPDQGGDHARLLAVPALVVALWHANTRVPNQCRGLGLSRATWQAREVGQDSSAAGPSRGAMAMNNRSQWRKELFQDDKSQGNVRGAQQTF